MTTPSSTPPASARALARGDVLVIASHNEGKVREIRELIAPFGLEVRSAGSLGLPVPDETGATFEENARIKSLAAASGSGLPALADDSGLVVDALNGEPGIYSARWAKDGKDFGTAMEEVERRLQAAGAKSPEQRRARFVAVLSLAWPDGRSEEYRGEIEGMVVWPPRGDLGFGYDPIFLPEGHEHTFGEMSSEAKHGWKPGEDSALSHRARAFSLFANTRLLGW